MQSGLSRVLILAVGVVLLRLLVRFSFGRCSLYFGLGLLLLLWVDIKTHTPDQNPSVPRYVYAPGLTKPEELDPRPRVGVSRLMLSAEAEHKLHTVVFENPVQTYLSYRLGCFANCNMIDNIPKVDGFFPLYLRNHADFIDHLAAADTNLQSVWVDFMGVCQVTKSGTMYSWKARTNAMPIVYSGQRPEFVSEAEMLTIMLKPGFDPRKTVLLPLQAETSINVTNCPASNITLSNVSKNSWDFKVTAQAPLLVTIAQSHHHNWQARIDGKPVRIWPANYAFQAVEVPAGSHDVRLVYVDWNFIAGVIVSSLTFLAVVIFWNRCKFRVSEAEN